MTGHFHIGFIQMLITFLSLIPAFAIWRIITFKLVEQDSSVGKAMAFIL